MNQVSGRFTATLLILVATWVTSLASDRRRPEHLAQPLDTIALQVGDWAGTDNPPLDEATLAVLQPDSYLSRTYRREGKSLGLFTAFYALQKAGETMHSPKNCLPGSGWEVWKYGTSDVPLGSGTVTINRYAVQKGPERMLVLYWYQTTDRVVASEYYAKVCMVWDAVLRGRTSGSLVRITLPDEPWALDAGVEFASQIIPLLQDCLPKES